MFDFVPQIIYIHLRNRLKFVAYLWSYIYDINAAYAVYIHRTDNNKDTYKQITSRLYVKKITRCEITFYRKNVVKARRIRRALNRLVNVYNKKQQLFLLIKNVVYQ